MPVINYIWKVIYVTLLQIIIVLGPGLILAFGMNFVSGLFERHAYTAIGRNLYLVLFGWLGTATHESGHALFCVIFRHKIVKIELFKPDPHTGTLGYVNHSYNKNSVYQSAGNFFIGIGPILLGTAVIYLLAVWLLGFDPVVNAGDLSLFGNDLGSWHGISKLFENIWDSTAGVLGEVFTWDNLSSINFYIFLYLVFAVGSSIKLSGADIKGALKGFVVILGLLLAFNLLTVWSGDFSIDAAVKLSAYFGVVYAVMLLALLLNLVTCSIMLSGPAAIGFFRNRLGV